MTEPPTGQPSEPEASQPPVAAVSEPPAPGRVWARIKEHKVAQWALAYAAAAYTLLHGVEMVSNSLSWPHVISRVVTLLLILGLPVVITLAWYHGARGLRKVSGAELTIITLLGIIAGSVLWALTRSSGEHTTAAPVAVTSTTAAAPRTAVAVLPFANLTGDATKEYLGDGMAEELINTLTKVQGLKVPARTSTFAYKGRNTDIRQIARDLGVGTILEGSVRAAGKTIRITAQLINAQDGLHLWSETYDEEFTDIFKLQDKLATAIATALQPNLLGAAEAAVSEGPPTRDVEAYNLYLQGLSLLERPSEKNAVKAIDNLERALARDPKFARAYAAISRAQVTWNALNPNAEHLAAAERATRQALALDPNLANAHLSLAGISAIRGQLLETEVHSRAAVSLAPNDGSILAVSAILLQSKGHLKQALEDAEKAYALAPATPQVVTFLAYQHALNGHDLEAAKYADSAVDLGFPAALFPLSAVRELLALRAKRYADAAAEFTKTMDMHDADQARTAEVVRLVYAALADPGKRNAALAARDRLYPTSATAATAGATHIDTGLCLTSAYYYALLGVNDVAYGLDDQCRDGAARGEVVGILKGIASWFIPEQRAFRRDPRFQALAAQVGWLDYWQKYGPPDDCDLTDGKLTCH